MGPTTYARDDSTEGPATSCSATAGSGVAIISRSDGTWTTAGHDMDLTITRGAEGYWHDGIDHHRRREMGLRPDPHTVTWGWARCPTPSKGRMHRADDDRVPDVWMAWGETVPANGERRHW